MAEEQLTDASLRRKWEAEPDDEERQRQKNDFFHTAHPVDRQKRASSQPSKHSTWTS